MTKKLPRVTVREVPPETAADRERRTSPLVVSPDLLRKIERTPLPPGVTPIYSVNLGAKRVRARG